MAGGSKIFISYRRTDDPGFEWQFISASNMNLTLKVLFMDVEGKIKVRPRHRFALPARFYAAAGLLKTLTAVLQTVIVILLPVGVFMPGNIFINYRRADTRHAAGRLYDLLKREFSHKRVFMDVDTIPLGVDFVEYLGAQVGKCQIMLSLIGPQWLVRLRQKSGDPTDFVRIEIEAALARNIRVIPVLIDGTAMPGEHDLPMALKSLPRRHAALLRHESFGADAAKLVSALRDTLGGHVPAVGVPPSAFSQSATSRFSLLHAGKKALETFFGEKEEFGQPVIIKNKLPSGKYRVVQGLWDGKEVSNTMVIEADNIDDELDALNDGQVYFFKL